ncbi:putative alpha-l-rhamnosidase c protein [Eutypa lata UCREL1]|uniref:Putative alpha-l-rhamnosidase c protein n=1 Tax=Eutypa lata (strain UCR-EL1) TaxID=1287681 RepID=M7T0I4_EUTLA|nr:putative alpha-l-rhamnosidase c protein [Eutypa lata UCREL1]
MTYEDTSSMTPLKAGQEDGAPEVTRTSSVTTKDDGTITNVSQRASIPQPQPQESIGSAVATHVAAAHVQAREYANGYHFPPKYAVKEQITMGLIAFWEFYNTGFGFFLTIYALNVIAWGGMLFLLLCNAAPTMCYDGDCNHIDSARRIWIETDSQILNALFCVTGLGLAPWRFRDAYYLFKYRLGKDQKALRALAGIHRGWFRLEGSETLPTHLGPKNVDEAAGTFDITKVPYPLETIPDVPLTGERAPPTKLWKLDCIVWLQLSNTAFQVCLCSFMWALNRYDRPSWSTGFFVCLACVVGCAAGVMTGAEGKAVKKIEGVPLTKKDLERLARDKELGIPHHNNYGDKDPEAEAAKKEEKKNKRWFRRGEKQKYGDE